MHCVAQECPDLHRRAKQARERLATRILEHQHSLAGLSHQFQRPDCPGAVQFVLQAIFVAKAVQAGRRWLFRSGPCQQEIAAGLVRAPSSIEDTLAVVPQDLQSVTHYPEASCSAFLRTQVSREDTPTPLRHHWGIV
ncbi:hypothetical protein D3C87_1269950 [compost metagenome]